MAEELAFKKLCESDGHETIANGFAARLLQAWIARESTPLPVPLSPRRRTVASLGATCRASSMDRCIDGEVLVRSISAADCPGASCNPETCCSSARRCATFCVTTATCAGVNGLGR